MASVDKSTASGGRSVRDHLAIVIPAILVLAAGLPGDHDTGAFGPMTSACKVR